jgi:hypothetical protein
MYQPQDISKNANCFKAVYCWMSETGPLVRVEDARREENVLPAKVKNAQMPKGGDKRVSSAGLLPPHKPPLCMHEVN